jgi:hypothetical protein
MRILNRLLAALLALSLIVIGMLLIIEVAAARLGHQPALVHWQPAYAWLHRTEWQQGSVRVVAAALLALGLLLLIAELKPARVSRLPVTEDSDAPDDVAYTRRGVAAALRAAVVDVDGVRSASVHVRRRSISVQTQAAAQDSDAAHALREPATAAARDRLASLQLASAPRLSVRVARRSR